MPSPEATIAIPLYNQADFISKTIESALSQNFGSFEVLVVDNCSTDGSAEIAGKYAKKNKHVRVVQNSENIGYVGNLNKCISEARGEYIQILHSDDIIEPNFLSTSISLFKTYPDCGLCFCNYKNIDENGKIHFAPVRNRISGLSQKISAEKMFNLLLERDFLLFCTTLVSKKAYKKCGIFDVMYPGPCDYQMWLKIAYKFPCAYNSASTSSYRIHPKAGTSLVADNNIILMEQYSMINKLFKDFIPPSATAKKQKEKMLRNTAMGSLRHSIKAMSEGKGAVARSKCILAITMCPKLIVHVMAGVLYFTAWFTPIIAIPLRFFLAISRPSLSRLGIFR